MEPDVTAWTVSFQVQMYTLQHNFGMSKSHISFENTASIRAHLERVRTWPPVPNSPEKG